MNYFAQGIMEGGRIGADLALAHKRRKFEREMTDQQVTQDGMRLKADRELREKVEAGRAALVQKQIDAAAARFAGERADRESDPVYQLARKKAQFELETFGQPKAPDELADLARQRDRLKLQSEITELGSPRPAPPPMAKVTQKYGDSTIVRDIPATDFEKSMGAMGYRSPHSDAIADLERQIAEQGAEIAGGDTRTGFMGVATSRQDVIAKAQWQRLQLKALELQDQVEKGVITQEEADRRAAALMQQ